MEKKKKESFHSRDKEGFFSSEAMEERIQKFLLAEKAKKPQKIVAEASLAD